MSLKEAEYHIEKAEGIIQSQRAEINKLKSERKRMDVKMRVCDIAEFFDCTPQTVHNMLNDRRLKSKKMIDVLTLKKRL